MNKMKPKMKMPVPSFDRSFCLDRDMKNGCQFHVEGIHDHICALFNEELEELESNIEDEDGFTTTYYKREAECIKFFK